jgi:hypothetical protein
VTNPVVELREAEQRIQHGDQRIDIELRGVIAELLGTEADLHEGDRAAADGTANCEIFPIALDLARRINRSQP